MKIHIGTSGWNFAHWKSVFYPDRMRPADWLAFYAQRLGTVELNVTFYGLTELRVSDPDGNRLWIGQSTSTEA